MGLTFVEAIVTGKNDMQRHVNFLVDSGASYSLLPEKVWKDLELEPKRKVIFTLADGANIERYVSECLISLEGSEGHSPVILGEPDDEPLLGVVTLENLGLMLDPFKRKLRAMKMRLS